MVTQENQNKSLSILSDWKRVLFSLCCIFTVTSFVTSILKLLPVFVSSLFALVAVVAGGTPILMGGVRALLHKELDVDFLASIAIIGAVFVINT